MAKTVTFGAKPNRLNDPENWVRDAIPQDEVELQSPVPKPMKRLTIDISEDLHRRIKVACAQAGTQIADEVRLLLQKRFGSDES